MPALASYIPPKNANLKNWLANFSSLITTAPSLYGLASADATNISNAVAAFNLAFTPITSPATKTAAAVSAFNTQKVLTLAVIRPYAQAISLNVGVSSNNKIALGLNPRTSLPGKIAAPASNPVLSVQSGSNLAIIMRYRDSVASVSTKAKPYGTKACEVWYQIPTPGTGGVQTPVSVPVASGVCLQVTKSPFTVLFPATAGGLQCYFWARWRTQTGLYSPWSPICAFTVPQAG